MCMAVSFVDRDMIMRYFGGGVGHLKNTPPQQAHRSDPVDPDSEEMEIEDEEDDTGGNTRGPCYILNASELEENCSRISIPRALHRGNLGEKYGLRTDGECQFTIFHSTFFKPGKRGSDSS